MNEIHHLDFEPIARNVYDDFLLSLPTVPVEGLFARDGEYFIVSPALSLKREDGRTIAEWFDFERRPAAHPIFLVKTRPEGAKEIASRTTAEVQSAFGVVQTGNDIIRDLFTRLPLEFPLVSVGFEERLLVITVSRSLERVERTTLDSALAATGNPLPLAVRVDGAAARRTGSPSALTNGKLELVPSRLRPDLPAAVRSFLEDDEAYWRDNFHRVLSGDLTAEKILGDRRQQEGSTCLVATTFPPGNIRTYLSLYDTAVLVMPLSGGVDEALHGLRVSRRELVDLAERKKVSFVAPQSIERYDAGLLAALAEVGASVVTGSRRLAAAVHADQVTRNPLFVTPGTALDRRTVLRALRRSADAQPETRQVMLALADGLANAWPSYEHLLHRMGAMASIAGPLAHVSRELAKRFTGNEYFIELGAAALNVEWASAFGAHFAPFESDDYSELGHCELLLAIHSGVPRGAQPLALARASRFQVAEELLVIDSDVDVIDFVTEIGGGDMLRFREFVRGLARPGRSDEEVNDLVAMWNRQVRRYERRPDRVKSMGLVGLLLGTAAKVSGAPDLVSLSAVVLPALPALLTHVQEDLMGEHASVGTLMDGLNARLAGVQREAVLLARLRKLVKGMK